MARNLVVVVMDSARWDLTKTAKIPNLLRLGKLEKRYSYASWTTPSHACLFMGLLPHESPKRVFASTTYSKNLESWKERLALPELEFGDFLPEFSLAKVLRFYGYNCHALVSMPVLNAEAGFARFFDSYKLMKKASQFNVMIQELKFNAKRPSFYFLNLGETHYPYLIPGDEGQRFKRVAGLHGVASRGDSPPQFFTSRDCDRFRRRQIRAIEYVDRMLKKLYEICPKDTWVVVTSDHGEMFGEEGYFGHGPIFHQKVFEVPFVENLVPKT